MDQGFFTTGFYINDLEFDQAVTPNKPLPQKLVKQILFIAI